MGKEEKAAGLARAELAKEKWGAAWLAMMDLSDRVKWAGVARKDFGRSPDWLLQRLHGYEVNGKPARFKPEEYATLCAALRSLAAHLTEAAARIEAAAPD